jgi:ribosomal protein L25 (general stress protein Ctc)
MKRLRREGFVPGVVYGGRDGECTSFKVESRALRQVLVAGQALIDLKVGSKTRPAARRPPASRRAACSST